MAAAESYPEELVYHPEHDWARIDGDEAVLGITWFAADALGELVHFEPPEQGASVAADESYGEVESVKAVSDLISIAMWALLCHPEQAEEVRGDAELIRPAVEEAARWHAPVGTSTRQTTRDVELAGTPLPAGALVAAVLASANRDPRQWQDADSFDIHSHRKPHLAFATGPHVCIGSLLGRFEARAAMGRLLARLPNLRLDPDRPAAFEGWEFRSPQHLHLLFDPA